MGATVKKIAGPAYISNAAADIYTPPAATIYTVIRHIHFVNKDTVTRTFSLYVGGTAGSAGGTELFKDKSLTAGETYDYYCYMRLSSTEFLSGIASAASAIVITVEGEQGVV